MRKAWLAVLVLMADGLVRAQTGVIPVYLCSLPGSQANVSGLKSINYQDGVIPSCTVTVYLTGTTSIATTTPQSPFTANTDGSIPPISAPLGIGYDVCMSGGIAPNTYPIGHPNCLVDLWPGGSSGGGGGGTVTSFTSGNLPPLFNTSVANPTTTPMQTFTAINQGAQTAFGNWSGATAPPFFATIVCAGVLSCSYNSGSNSFTLSASSYQTIIQVNGTPTTPVSPVNLNDTTPAAKAGFINGNFQQDGSGNVSVEVPNAPSQFTMFPGPPISGQYALIYPSSCSFTANPGNITMLGSCSGGAGSMNAHNISGVNPASGYLSYIFTLPAGISQANITAVYAAGVYSMNSAGISEYLEPPSCTDGTTSVNFFGANVSQLPLTGTSVLFGSVPTVSSVSCKLDAEGSGYIYPGTGGYLGAGGGFALYVYYTGTPIAPPPTQVIVWSPLQINNGNLTLAVPYNVGYDWSNTNSYNVTIPAYLAPGNAIAPGAEIVLEVQNSNTSTTVTVNANGTVRPVRLKDGVTLPAIGDIASNGSGGLGPPAVLRLDGGGFYWDLQNPQVSGGSLASALTGAASGGASPGTTYDGSTARTFDYHTFGAPGLAATTNTFSGTLNDYSGTSQFKLPVAAGYAAAAQGEAGYDSTDKNWNLWANGANNIAATFPAASPPSDTDCAQWSVSGGHYVLSFASGSCGTGSGGDTITSPNGTIKVGGTATNTTLDVADVGVVSKDTSTPVTVSTTACYGFYNNQNATPGTAVTYNLPAAATCNNGLPKQFCFKNSSNATPAPDTGTLKIQTSASGQYIIDATGTLSASDGYVISGGAASDGACVVGVDATHWQLYVGLGTWTTH